MSPTSSFCRSLSVSLFVENEEFETERERQKNEDGKVFRRGLTPKNRGADADPLRNVSVCTASGMRHSASVLSGDAQRL